MPIFGRNRNSQAQCISFLYSPCLIVIHGAEKAHKWGKVADNTGHSYHEQDEISEEEKGLGKNGKDFFIFGFYFYRGDCTGFEGPHNAKDEKQ